MASKISINLDTSKENYLVCKCKQNDDLNLEAFIYENGLALDLTNKEIIIQALKSNNTHIVQNTGITKENNKMLSDLVRDFTRSPGTTKIEILLIEEGKQNATFSFYLEVVRSVIDSSVESSNTVTILEELENKIVEAGAVKEETEQLIQNGGAATTGQIAEINASLEENKKILRENSLGLVPTKISNATLTENYLGVLPICTKNGVLYGFKDNTTIVKSTDEGDTWANLSVAPSGSVHSLYFTEDGEVLICNATSIWKSSGWSVNPSTVTWSVKVTKSATTGVGIIPWSFDGYGRKFIATEYSGANRGESRYVWISTDNGNTFNIVYDKSITDPDNTSHMHGVCYDKWADRFFLSHGHGVLRGVYYSDDDGVTWNKIGGDFQPDACPTTLTATDNGIVCGSDSGDGGLYGIKRTENPQNMRMEYTSRWYVNRQGVTGFAYRSVRDEETGQVYVSFKSDFNDVSSIIMCGTATNGDTIWVSPKKALSTFTHLTVTRNRILGLLTENSVATFIKATKPYLSTKTYDSTNSLSGVSRNATSIALGNDVNINTAYEVVIGQKAKISENTTGTQNVVIGYNAQGYSRSVAIGNNSNSNNSDQVVIGNNTSCGGANAVSIGVNSKVDTNQSNGIAIGNGTNATLSSIAIGNSATNRAGTSSAISIGTGATSGNNSIAIGSNASSGTTQVAIGQKAVSNHSNSVALGDNTTTTKESQLQIGARHIEMYAVTEPTTVPTDAGRLFVLKDTTNNKLKLCVRLGGTTVVLAEVSV